MLLFFLFFYTFLNSPAVYVFEYLSETLCNTAFSVPSFIYYSKTTSSCSISSSTDSNSIIKYYASQNDCLDDTSIEYFSVDENYECALDSGDYYEMKCNSTHSFYDEFSDSYCTESTLDYYDGENLNDHCYEDGSEFYKRECDEVGNMYSSVYCDSNTAGLFINCLNDECSYLCDTTYDAKDIGTCFEDGEKWVKLYCGDTDDHVEYVRNYIGENTNCISYYKDYNDCNSEDAVDGIYCYENKKCVEDDGGYILDYCNSTHITSDVVCTSNTCSVGDCSINSGGYIDKELDDQCFEKYSGQWAKVWCNTIENNNNSSSSTSFISILFIIFSLFVLS